MDPRITYINRSSPTLHFLLLKKLGKIFSRSSNMSFNFSLRIVQALSKALDVVKETLLTLNMSSKDCKVHE